MPDLGCRAGRAHHWVCGDWTPEGVAARCKRCRKRRTFPAVLAETRFRRYAPPRKVTDEQVAAIRASTEGTEALGKRYGISRGYVSTLRGGRRARQ